VSFPSPASKYSVTVSQALKLTRTHTRTVSKSIQGQEQLFPKKKDTNA